MQNSFNPAEPHKSTTQGRVVVIQIDGTKTSVEASEPATLQRMYHVIGCDLVEVVELPSRRGRKMQMIVDEMGLAKSLDLNPIASGLAGRAIVGIAVLLMGKACWT